MITKPLTWSCMAQTRDMGRSLSERYCLMLCVTVMTQLQFRLWFWPRTLILKPCQSCQCMPLYDSTFLFLPYSYIYNISLLTITYDMLLHSSSTFPPLLHLQLCLLFSPYIRLRAHVLIPLEWLLFVLVLSQSEILSGVPLDLPSPSMFPTVFALPASCFPSWIILISLLVVPVPSWGHQQALLSLVLALDPISKLPPSIPASSGKDLNNSPHLINQIYQLHMLHVSGVD